MLRFPRHIPDCRLVCMWPVSREIWKRIEVSRKRKEVASILSPVSLYIGRFEVARRETINHESTRGAWWSPCELHQVSLPFNTQTYLLG